MSFYLQSIQDPGCLGDVKSFSDSCLVPDVFYFKSDLCSRLEGQKN